MDAFVFGIDFCEKLVKYIRLRLQKHAFPIVSFDKLVDGIVCDAVVGPDLHYRKIPRLRLGVLAQKIRQTSFFRIVKIPVEPDEQGIVGGT